MLFSGLVAVVGSPAAALFAFNRPGTAARNLAAISRAEPAKLYLFCDGPRLDRPDDIESTAAVRKALEAVDWDCEVERVYRDINVGCSANIELGLDHLFDVVDEAVVLEDDCIPDPSFFRYCAEVLDRYRNHSEIVHVGGFTQDIDARLFRGKSYAVSTIAWSLGWATWADRWKAHRRRMPRDWEGVPGDALAPVATVSSLDLQPHRFYTGAGRRGMEMAYRQALTQGLYWDQLMALSYASIGGLAITPSVSMIAYEGYGPEAITTKEVRPAILSHAMGFPLDHPTDRTVNRAVSRDMEFDSIWAPLGSGREFLRSRIRPRPLRSFVVRGLTSGIVADGLMRLAKAQPERRATGGDGVLLDQQ